MNTVCTTPRTTSWLVRGCLAMMIAMGASSAWAGDAAINIGGIDQPGGVIKGVIHFKGKQAKRKPIRMSADAFCDGAHKGAKARNERYVFGDNDTLVNVFVWVSKGPRGKNLRRPLTKGRHQSAGLHLHAAR